MATFIGNPRAGRGAVARRWPSLLEHAGRLGLEPTGLLTTGPGHATELARQARRDGAGLVVAVGGDGTAHEVANGVLADGAGPDVPTLGVVPAGSGCDYARTFGLPADVDGALAALATDAQPRTVDVGELRVAMPDGERTRLFVNIAEVGIGAAVARRAAGLPRALGAGVYVVSFCLTLPVHRQVEARIGLDGDERTVPLTNLVVAIGQYFGGGMRVAPAADPSDGRFDVQVQSGSKLDYALAMPKVFRGTHLPHPRVREARAATVEVDCDPPAPVEADGEVLGTTPATFRILPGALLLKG